MTSSKTTKRALFSSALAMVMCVAMLIGTTFAWFTDTASTSVNKIQAGTLDVALEMEETPGNWVSAEGKTLDFVKAQGHENEEILWEPGCTYKLPKLRVVNNGNLALKYAIQITGIQGDAELNDVITWTIGDIALGTEQHLAVGENAEFTISGTMSTTAGNEYQNKSIDGISITVYATQDTVEYDSNGNQYDANAPLASYWDGKTTEALTPDAEGKYRIKNAAQFAKLMEETSKGTTNSLYFGKTFVLDCDIDFGGRTISGIGSDNDNIVFTFDGNGHTISNFKINNTRKIYSGLFNQFNGTVKNLTVENATVIGNKMVGVIASNVENNGVIDNCHVKNATVISNVKKAGAITGYTANGTVTNCTATNVNIYCADTATSESGEIVGFVNAGSTVTDNTATNVTVTRGTTQVAESVLKEGNTYFISGVAGLQWFNDQINKSRNSFNNMTIELISDVDMNGANWLPAGQNFATAYGNGYNTVQFLGTFNGNNHTISNINIVGVSEGSVEAFAPDEQQVYSVGFIGYSCGTVKNLTIKKATVTGYHYVGTIVGMTDSDTAIVNCHVEDTKITAKHLNDDQCGDKVGGIVGNLYNGIKDCTVKNTVISAGRDAGQVVGCAQSGSTVDGCSAENVTVEALTGCTGANIKNEIIGRDLG